MCIGSESMISKENLSLTLTDGRTKQPLPMLSEMLTGFKEASTLALNLL